MFTNRELQEIIELVSQSPIQKFKYSDGTVKLVITKDSPVSKSNGDKRKWNAEEQIADSSSLTSRPTKDDNDSEFELIQTETNRSELVEIVAPTIGTFYLSPEQGAAPYVQVGDKVEPEQVVCVLEAMKLFTKIAAKVSGQIAEILVEDGQFVEYGQPLFLVKPE